jgi:hypothetical protein
MEGVEGEPLAFRALRRSAGRPVRRHLSGDAMNEAPSVASAPARPGSLWLWRGARILAGGLFVAAGALKVAAPKEFARTIVEYHLMPEGLVPLLAVALPWWEVTAGGLAVAGAWRRGALAVLTGLSAVFVVAGAITLARGLAPPCGCFGPLESQLSPATVGRALGLLVLGGALLWRELRLDPGGAPTRPPDPATGGSA